MQSALGQLSIRSGYRSCAVNAKGAENRNQYNCASNESNYAGHIWDVRDADGYIGATACIIVNSFISYYEQTQDWTALAWWIHDHIDAYAAITFFPKYAAFNISWRENPKVSKSIYSYVKNPHTGKSGFLTKQGMDNFSGTHEFFYKTFVEQLASSV
ncbi:MAG: peptidase M15 [Cyanobacteria bacterium J06576_12]